MLARRFSPAFASLLGASTSQCIGVRKYSFFVFKDPERRPQLTPDERAKVNISYDEWPEQYRDLDPNDPYKNIPDFIEGMTSWNLFLWGAEAAFIYHLYETVFPKKM